MKALLVLLAACNGGPSQSNRQAPAPPPPDAAPAPEPYAANHATPLLPVAASPPEREERWPGTYAGTATLSGMASGTVDFRVVVTADGDGVVIEKPSERPGGSIKCRAARSPANKNLASCEGVFFTASMAIDFELAAAMHDDSLALVVYTPDHSLARLGHPETIIRGMTSVGVLPREKPH